MSLRFPAHPIALQILFDRSKPEERVRAEKLLRVLIDDAAKLGYGEYRTHISMADQVAGTYSALPTFPFRPCLSR